MKAGREYYSLSLNAASGALALMTKSRHSLNKLVCEDFIRSFDRSTIASALGIAPKDLGNFLQRAGIADSGGRRQGVRQRMSVGAVSWIFLAFELHRTLGLPANPAGVLASKLINGQDAVLSSLVSVSVDISRLNRLVQERLREAAEIVIPKARGRPPARHKRIG